MATTYELIASQTLGSDTATVTFSSIPGTYDDLLMIISGRTDRTPGDGDGVKARFNGAGSDANCSNRQLYMGFGPAAFSTSSSIFLMGRTTSDDDTSDTFGNSELYIPNYASTSYAKSGSSTGVSENNGTNSFMSIHAALWNDTSAITDIELLSTTASNFRTGSSFYLYGITKA